MSTLGKVFLVLVALASIGMFYLCARTLKTLEVHRSIYNDYVIANESAQAEITKLQGRSEEYVQRSEGQWQAIRKLNVLLSNRGRAWFDCAFQLDPPNNATAMVVTVEQPNPHEITDKNVLHVFEQTPAGDPSKGIQLDNPQRELRYLGEFQVAEVAGPQVKLTPAGFNPQKPVPRSVQMQLARMANAQGPLALYEQMPVDIHEIWMMTQRDYPQDFGRFFGAAVPPDVVKKFLHDGEAATPEDENEPERILVELKFLKDFAELTAAQQKELGLLGFSDVIELTAAGDPVRDADGKEVRMQVHNVIRKDATAYFLLNSPDKKEGPAAWLTRNGVAQELKRTYHRPLRDYGLYFRQIYRQLPVLENRMAELTQLIERKKAEEKIIVGNIDYSTNEQNLLKTERTTLSKELRIVTELHRELTREIADAEARIAQLEAANQQLAEQYRKAQIAHADRINREAREKSSQKTSTRPSLPSGKGKNPAGK